MPAIHEVIIRIRGQSPGVAQTTRATRALNTETQRSTGATRALGASSSTLNKALGKQATATTRVRGGMGTLRSVLGSLGARAVGVTGTLGTMTSAIGFMAIGNLASIGVLGGMAAVAFALKTIRDRAKEAREEIEALFEEGLKKFTDDRASDLTNAFVLAGNDLRTARESLRSLRAGESVEFFGEKLANKIAEVETDVARLIRIRAGLDQTFREEFGDFVLIPDGSAERLREAARAAEGLRRQIQSMSRSVAANRQQWERFGETLRLKVRTPQEQFREEVERINDALAKGVVTLETYNRSLDRAVLTLGKAAGSSKGKSKLFTAADLATIMGVAKDTGKQMGFLIAQSIITALNAVRGGGFFGGVLGVLGGIVGFVATGGNPGGAGVGAAAGQTLGGIIDDEISNDSSDTGGGGGVVIVPASINLNVQSADPNMVAQSAVFQTQLREGLRRAEEDGFKFVRISRG